MTRKDIEQQFLTLYNLRVVTATCVVYRPILTEAANATGGCI